MWNYSVLCAELFVHCTKRQVKFERFELQPSFKERKQEVFEETGRKCLRNGGRVSPEKEEIRRIPVWEQRLCPSQKPPGEVILTPHRPQPHGSWSTRTTSSIRSSICPNEDPGTQAERGPLQGERNAGGWQIGARATDIFRRGRLPGKQCGNIRAQETSWGAEFQW